MNSNKYIFIDRDGVIVRDKNYMYKISDMEFLPCAIEGLKKIQSLGYQFIVISNQAGIARKLYTENDAKMFNNEMVRQMNFFGVSIMACYYCPHHPDFTGECLCRKPKTGMVEMAANVFGISLSKAIFIGDKDCDTELGKNCGGITILVQNNQYGTAIQPDFTVRNLNETVDILSALNNKKTQVFLKNK